MKPSSVPFDAARRRLLARLAACAGVAAFPLAGCGGGGGGGGGSGTLRIAVLSDPHLFETGLLGDGPELLADLGAQRRTERQSAELLDAALAAATADAPDLLLVTGDLTKDGERANHEAIAARLAAVRARGIRTFVIPGNHDVSNPAAKDYRNVPATAAEAVDAAGFAAVHAGSGYGDAIARDPASLSYVAALADDVWLIAVDSCRYGEPGATAPVSAGRVRAETLTWLDERLAQARARGVTPIGAMHHGLVEHFDGQAAFFGDYLVAEREAIAARWAAAGLRVVFTGHFHAQDVAAAATAGGTIHDVETGSPLSGPAPYRVATLDRAARQLRVRSGRVAATPAHPQDYVEWSRGELSDALESIVATRLAAPPHAASPAQIAALMPLALPAMLAHFAGDERLDDAATRSALEAMTRDDDPLMRAAGGLILGLWSDPPPADGEVTIAL